MARNRIINYTNTDYESLRTQIEEHLKQDPRFENIKDSSVAKTLLDVFAAMTDFNNYYIERRAEETFFDTARLKSSVIRLARNLGYVVTRPRPAQASLGITLNGPLNPTISAGDTVAFNKYSTDFVGEGLPFILKDTYTYTFTSADIVDGAESSWAKTITKAVSLSATSDEIPLDSVGDVDSQALLDIALLQGEIKTNTILGSSNKQVGLLFQQYLIDDNTCSNYYGEEDLGYNRVTDVDTILENLTKVAIGTTSAVLADENELFTIRRRSITDSTRTYDDSEIPRLCLMRTNSNEGIDLNFGDDIFAEKGAATSDENIYVQYFSTEGANANQTGIVGNSLVTNNSFVTDKGASVDIGFTFAGNITNGTDIETIESIKLNAPELFYSLDRLVTSRDYISYLKTQVIGTSGQNIKNAVSWGEQEEILERSQVANFRFFNIVLFSVLGKLYNFPVGGTNTYLSDSEITEAYLETSNDFSSISETVSGVVSADGYPEQSYFNIFVKETPNLQVRRIEDYRSLDPNHPILDMYDRLEKRGQGTVNHVYITPIVQKFKLNGRVTINKLENRTEIQKRINNELYTWLNDNADFVIDMHKSSLYDIIQSYISVKNSNVYFTPVVPSKLITTWADDPDISSVTPLLGSYTSADLISVYNSRISEFITSAGYALIPSTSGESNLDIDTRTTDSLAGGSTGIWANIFGDNWYFEDVGHKRVGNVTERAFYTELMKNIYDDLQTWVLTTGENYVDSQYFKNIMYKMNNDLKEVIRTSMINSEGNITNYSFKNEIIQIQINLNYVFA